MPQLPLSSAIRSQRRVFGAVLLHELRMRIGGRRNPLLLTLCEPALHLAGLSALFALLGGVTVDQIMGLLPLWAAGVIPFLQFRNTATSVLRMETAQGATAHHAVTPMDAMLVRMVMELLAALVLMSALFALLLATQGAASGLLQGNLLLMMLALIMAGACGLGLGALGLGLGRVVQAVPLVIRLLMPVPYVGSGIFLSAVALQKMGLSANPMLHVVDLARQGFGLVPDGMGKLSMAGFATLVLLSCGLLVEHSTRALTGRHAA